MLDILDLVVLTGKLVTYAYPNLSESQISIQYKKIKSYGDVSWEKDSKHIVIRINPLVKKWHDSGKIGLISHELSHTFFDIQSSTEIKTDNHVISRGLGHYLAIERVLAGKYNDHIISKKDRYLGYRTIREILTERKRAQLDLLLQYLRLTPKRHTAPLVGYHDSIIYRNESVTHLNVGGYIFTVDHVPNDADLKLVFRNNSVTLYIDEIPTSSIMVDL